MPKPKKRELNKNNNVLGVELEERPSIFNKLKGAFNNFKYKLKNKTTNFFSQNTIEAKK